MEVAHEAPQKNCQKSNNCQKIKNQINQKSNNQAKLIAYSEKHCELNNTSRALLKGEQSHR